MRWDLFRSRRGRWEPAGRFEGDDEQAVEKVNALARENLAAKATRPGVSITVHTQRGFSQAVERRAAPS